MVLQKKDEGSKKLPPTKAISYGDNDINILRPNGPQQRVCAIRAHMKAEGKFLGQIRTGYFARVHLDIELSAIAIIAIGQEKYENSFSQGEIIKAPCSKMNFDDWIEGARLGVKYGLTKSRNNYKVIIESIEGLFTDTNPLIISVAAIIGIWSFLEYQPSESELEKIEQWALESWTLYKDSYPHELRLLQK